jgi:hypothetical protein
MLGSNPRRNRHRAKSMPKASTMGVEVESLPPGTCNLPLATTRKIPGVWGQSPQERPASLLSFIP